MAAAVAEWEAAATNVPKSTRVVIIRTGIVLARDGGVLARMLPIFELFAGRCIRQLANTSLLKDLPMQLYTKQQEKESRSKHCCHPLQWLHTAGHVASPTAKA